MKKIMIIKTSSLGDIIQTFPVLDFLRKKFGDIQIDWVVEEPFSELVMAHPKVSNVICVDTKKWRKEVFRLSTYKAISEMRRQLRDQEYDVVFDLQGNVKSGLILSQVKSKKKVGFDKSTVPERPNTFFTNYRFNPPANHNIREDYLAIVKMFFQDQTPNEYDQITLKISDIQTASVIAMLNHPVLGNGPKVVVCPGSNWRNKQLTSEALETFLSEMQHYLNCNFIFLWGNILEKEVAERLHEQFLSHSVVMDRMSLPEVQNLMAAVDLVVAMDSLPLHLAGTTSTPTFSVFGPSLAKKYKPLGPRHYAFQGNCPYGKTFNKRCPILRTCPTGACMREISGSGELFAKFLAWWKEIA